MADTASPVERTTPTGTAGIAGTGPGRRERKKAATRAAISTAALELFLDRGFDAVSIRDIAERADVAVATIFAHFAGKEALVFDEGDEIGRSLIAAVADRPDGTDPVDALERWFLEGRAAEAARSGDPDFAAFRELVARTPVLRDHWHGMWRRYEPGLAAAIVASSDAGRRLADLIAALTIEGYLRATEDERPDEALHLLFAVLRSGVGAAAGGAEVVGAAAGGAEVVGASVGGAPAGRRPDGGES